MVTEVTNESWFQRIGNAFKGILVGIVLFAAAVCVLFWNEGRAVDRARALTEGLENVRTASPDAVADDNDQKLVHMTGTATTDETATDDMFSVSSPNTLKLRRKVLMYQWQEDEDTEKRKKVGGGTETTTTYTYEKVWSESPISSSDFHPEGANEYGEGNPPMPFGGATHTSTPITVGAFTLNPGLVGQIESYESLQVDAEAVAELPENIKQGWSSHDGGLYRSLDPNKTGEAADPQVGDLKVAFEVVKPTDVSLIAQQTGDTFQAYQPKSASSTLEILAIGLHSSDELISAEQTKNSNLTWILRGVGLVLMTIGIALVFNPLVVLGDVIPLIGNILGAGVLVFAIVIATAGTLTTISIAWLFFRPVIGISLLVGAIGIIAGAIVMFRSKKVAVA